MKFSVYDPLNKKFIRLDKGIRKVKKPNKNKQVNRQLINAPEQYPIVTFEWLNLKKENKEIFNEYCINSFYSLQNQLENNMKEYGAATYSYLELLRGIKYEILKRMKYNNKRLFQTIYITSIHPRFFDYFCSKNNGIRNSFCFKNNIYISYQWIGINNIFMDLNDVKNIDTVDIWNIDVQYSGGYIKQLKQYKINYIRLTLNCSNHKVIMAFGFEVIDKILENTSKFVYKNNSVRIG